ncbi:hypothetical protein TL16_g01222 [Triparma laevis f. inornata]|uniref:Uncharacterized protein n=2 Tax=Triparma laevis TaxID=1534972 RepID=A0A9W6ZNG4_9STRA|nr:hypothetical protein TL16_g01222 [Triparma laevis f. inornata]GMH54218.1 hypothetical protein TrLO_g6397 [Triparma laevis f. longispina]
MSQGFGICGHKNAYSSGVKEGKWVEDLVGMDLAQNPPNHPTLYTTEQREKIIPPADMENRAGGEDLNMLTMDEIKVKNKGGLPSHMLFEHMGAPGSDRFMSVNAMTFTAGVGSGGIRCEDLLGEKPSDEAKEALKIKPVKKKMINKSKGDARLDGLINSFETTSAGMAARANVRKARVNPFEGKELGEQLPGVTFHRKAISIGTALG